jgi:hypothetical protein
MSPTLVCIILALVILALLVDRFALQRQHNKQTLARERTWDLERGALLTRIQHPEFVVATESAPVIPDEEYLTSEPDDIDLVGTISTGSDNGDSPSD